LKLPTGGRSAAALAVAAARRNLLRWVTTSCGIAAIVKSHHMYGSRVATPCAATREQQSGARLSGVMPTSLTGHLQLPLGDTVGRKYTVVPHDTLSKIAQRFYGDPAWYTTLATVNGIPDPDHIDPGDVLDIPDVPTHTELFRSWVKMSDGKDGHPGLADIPDRVPAGKRLVIETVTGYCTCFGHLGPAVLFGLGDAPDSRIVLQGFPWTQCPDYGDSHPNALNFLAFNHCVRMYVDGPAYLRFQPITALGLPSNVEGRYTVSGYLEAIPPW
jgi:LysM domain